VVLTNVTSATTLSVTGTTGACSATASAAITVTACSLTTTISGRLDRCPGGTTSLTAVGPTGANYRWSSGENTAVISASLATQYSVTVTGTDNCTATATRQITTRALPTVSITPTPSLLVCPGTSVTLTATSGLSYSWSSGANTAFISFVPTSTTVLSVTASDGVCSSLPASVTVTVQPSVTATITPNPGLTICASAGGLLMASGAGQGGSYRWNTNANTAQITVNSSGPYTVTATSSAGCSGTATVSITALNPFPLAQPVLSASSSVVCEGGSASVTATVTGSVQTYQWYRNGISLGSAQSSSVLNGVSQAGSYVLVIGTSGCGSATSTAFTLTVNPLPTVTIAFPTSANVNPAGPVVTVPVGTGLSYQVFGGGSNARYERKIIIDRINGFELRTVLDNQTGIFPIDRAGPYTITVTDANGCSRTVTGEIVGR
jgi:large repetitive protein